MSERKPCQCGSIDFTGEDESQAYETPRAFHWFDRPCEAKPQPPTTKAELRAALFSATERAERAERERDEARADHLRVRDECFATMEALADERKACDAASELSEARYVEACNQAQRAVEMEAERDAARSEVERLRKEILDVHDALHRECFGPVDLPGEIRALRSRASAAESDRASLEERLDAALARLHETREALALITNEGCVQLAMRDDGLRCWDAVPGVPGRPPLSRNQWCPACIADRALAPSPAPLPGPADLRDDRVRLRERVGVLEGVRIEAAALVERLHGQDVVQRLAIALDIAAPSPSTTPETRGDDEGSRT